MTGQPHNGTYLLRVLLDEDRLRVLGLLSLAPRSVTELAEATGMGTADVRHHLRSLRRLLVDHRLMERAGGVYWHA